MKNSTLIKAIKEGRGHEYGLEVIDDEVMSVEGLSGQDEIAVLSELNSALQCDICGGFGFYEEVDYYRDEETGYNTVTERTGIYKPCPHQHG